MVDALPTDERFPVLESDDDFPTACDRCGEPFDMDGLDPVEVLISIRDSTGELHVVHASHVECPCDATATLAATGETIHCALKAGHDGRHEPR